MGRLKIRIAAAGAGILVAACIMIGQRLQQVWLAMTSECATVIAESELERVLGMSVDSWRAMRDDRGCRSTAVDRDMREIASVAVSRSLNCSVEGFGGRSIEFGQDAQGAVRYGIWEARIRIDGGGCIQLRLGNGALRIEEADVRALATVASHRGSALRAYVERLSLD